MEKIQLELQKDIERVAEKVIKVVTVGGSNIAKKYEIPLGIVREMIWKYLS